MGALFNEGMGTSACFSPKARQSPKPQRSFNRERDSSMKSGLAKLAYTKEDYLTKPATPITGH